jgi:hypothetical protein
MMGFGTCDPNSQSDRVSTRLFTVSKKQRQSVDCRCGDSDRVRKCYFSLIDISLTTLVTP